MVPPIARTCCCDSMRLTTGFSHSGANSLEWLSSSLSTLRANLMIAVCIPRQMTRNGRPVPRARPVASGNPLHASNAEAARDEQAVIRAQDLTCAFGRGEQIAREPRDVDADV